MSGPVTLPSPAVLGDLWDHQVDAFHLAVGEPGYLLAHDMGTGKGATTIALLEYDQADRVLILCPRNVTGVWPVELNGPIMDPDDPDKVMLPDGWSPRRWETWNGRVVGARGLLKNPSVARRAEAGVKTYTDALKLRRPYAMVVNYEACWQGAMRELVLGTPWDTLICDESHRLKAPAGKAARLAAAVADRVRTRGGRVLELTGTPMPHSPLDAWSQLRILDGGDRFGTSYHKFCQRYAKPENIRVAGGNLRTVYKEIDPDRLDRFTDLLAEVMHQVSADDVLDLPEATDRYIAVELDARARAVYDDLERHGIAEAEGGTLTAANAMVLVLRLAQASSGFGKDADTGTLVHLTDGPSDKAAALADFLEDVPRREPVVVFARFHADLDAIAAVCARQGRVYGELSGRRRDGLTDESRMSPDIDVLGAQLKSGGVGINLTRARLGVYYSLDFTLADYLQSRRRLVRPGQTRPVLFAHLLVKDTVDPAIYGALRRRREVVDAVIAHLNQKGPTP